MRKARRLRQNGTIIRLEAFGRRRIVSTLGYAGAGMETTAAGTPLGGWTQRAAVTSAAAIITAVLLAQALRIFVEVFFQGNGVEDNALLRVQFVPAGMSPLAIAMPAALVVALIFSRTLALRLALATILAGSVSNNLIERLLLGRVTTYLRISSDRPPVNLADVLITAGTLALFLIAVNWLIFRRPRTTDPG
jgi:hypothetical protein